MSVSQQSLNRLPVQLLRYLGLSGPDAPNRLADGVQGTADLQPWWVLSHESARRVSIAPAVATIGFQAVATVPTDQRWLISGLTAQSAALAAAHTLQLCCAYQQVDGGVYAIGDLSNSAIVAQAVLATGLWDRTKFVLLGPGDILGYYVTLNTGAAPPVVALAFRVASFTV